MTAAHETQAGLFVGSVVTDLGTRLLRPDGTTSSICNLNGTLDVLRSRASVEIEVLSSAAGRSSGYLVRHGITQVLVDCGPGTSRALTRLGHLDRLDGIVITHQHADHASDVIGLAYARRFPNPMAQIPLLAPEAALQAIRQLDDLFAVPTLPEMGSTIRSAFNLHALRMDGTTEPIAGGLSLSALHHNYSDVTRPTLAVR